jgi:hypothetical protein
MSDDVRQSDGSDLEDDENSPHSEITSIDFLTALRIAAHAPDSYGLVLFLLLLSFILGPLASGPQWLWARALFQGATMLLALHTSRVQRRNMRLAGALCVGALVLALAVVETGGQTASEGVLYMVTALLLAATVPAILHQILTGGTAGGETILGALDVYIIFGLFFAAVYAAIGSFAATPFFGEGAHVTTGSYQFFSFVTLTTVGYGNLVPATQIGQSLAVLEALVGQIYLVTLVASLVSRFQVGTRRSTLRRLSAEHTARRAAKKADAQTDSERHRPETGP